MVMQGDQGGRTDRRCPAVVAKIGIGVLAAALLIDVVALVLDLERLRRLRGGETLETVGLEFASTISDAANLAVPAGVLVAAAAFGWWFWCAYRRWARAGLAEHQPNWAIIGWLIPGLNLIRPPSIMRELAAKPISGLPADRSGSALVAGWWILWVLGGLVQVGLRVLLRFVTPETNAAWSWWQGAALMANIALLVGAAWCMALIATADERQRALGRRRTTPADQWAPVR